MFNRRGFLAGCCLLPVSCSLGKVCSTEVEQPFTQSISVCLAPTANIFMMSILKACYDRQKEKVEEYIKITLRINSPITVTCTDVVWVQSQTLAALRIILQGDKKMVCNEFQQMCAKKIYKIYFDKYGEPCTCEQAESEGYTDRYEYCSDAKMSHLIKNGVHFNIQELMQDYHVLHSRLGRLLGR
jgi:hypothetical protein